MHVAHSVHSCGCCSLVSSVLSPTTSNVVKQPLKLSELHSEAPESSSACAKLFGTQANSMLHALMRKYLVWLLVVVPVIATIQHFWPSVPVNLVYSLFFLVLSVLLALCLNVGVTRKLVKVLGIWYFIVSVIGGQVSSSLTYGPRFYMVDGVVDTARQISRACSSVAVGLALIVGGAFLNAVFQSIAAQGARTALISFVCIYKSRALTLGRF